MSGESPQSSFQVIIDGQHDGDVLHLTVTARPMIATHTLARILENTAGEIRAGRLDALEIRPLNPEE